jgi:metal transporter CNNM
MEVPTPLIWLGIGFCVSQSAIFSGLNLALFSVSRLRLEIEAAAGNRVAKQVVSLRADANGLLTTILWGNVSANVLLALLSNSVMAGAAAFLFSTFVITLVGEIIPQAYFYRNALKMATLFIPLLKVYRVLLYPVAKPCALILDAWLGRESIHYFREQDLTEVIRRHMASDESDVDILEGLGAINFLALDDVPLSQNGEPVDPASVLPISVVDGHLIFPAFERRPNDPFLRQVNASGHKWVVLNDSQGQPACILDADGFLRAALIGTDPCNPYNFCHKPIVTSQPDLPLGDFLRHLKRSAVDPKDDVIDKDIILLWGKEKRIITGADILGRLLRGIASQEIIKPQAGSVIPSHDSRKETE